MYFYLTITVAQRSTVDFLSVYKIQALMIIYSFYQTILSSDLCTHLCSWGVDVLHVLNAAYAVIGHFTAGQTDEVPKTALTIKPAARACKRRDVGDRLHLYHWLKNVLNVLVQLKCNTFLPLKRWLRMCSRIAAKLMNSSDESSMGSAVYFSSSVFTENLPFKHNNTMYFNMEKNDLVSILFYDLKYTTDTMWVCFSGWFHLYPRHCLSYFFKSNPVLSVLWTTIEIPSEK